MELKISTRESQDGLTRQLSEARLLRKKADEDVRLLANRIALLRQEEVKAWRNIEETRKKAKDIVKLRVQHREIQNQHRRTRLKQVAQSKKRIETIRKHHQEKVYGLKERIQSQNVLKAQTLKQEKAIRQQVAHELKVKEQEEKRKQFERVKLSHKFAQERLRRKEEAKKARAKSQANLKLKQEVKSRHRTEAFIEQLEQEELELIQRLQNTQMLQQNADEELALALAT